MLDYKKGLSSLTFETKEFEEEFSVLVCSDFKNNYEGSIVPITKTKLPPKEEVGEIEESEQGQREEDIMETRKDDNSPQKKIVPNDNQKDITSIPRKETNNIPLLPLQAAIITGMSASFVRFVRKAGSIFIIGLIIREIGLRLYGLFVSKGKRKFDWGTVYDIVSGKPVPLARVEIIDVKRKKVKDFRITDSLGSYSFLVSPGMYVLNPNKEGYTKVTKDSEILEKIPTLYTNTYDYQPFQYDEYARVDADIAMQNENRNIASLIRNKGVWDYIFDGIFWLGFALSIYILTVNPNLWNGCVVFAYLIFYAIQLFGSRKLTWGTVINSEGFVQQFATIKLFDSRNETLIARSITDEKGRYLMIANPGEYIMTINTIDGKEKRVSLSVRKRGTIKQNMVI